MRSFSRAPFSDREMSSENPQLDALLERLPHKPPMRLLDKVIEASAARAICATEMDTRKAALFGDARGGIRACIGIELIAQAAAIAMASAIENGAPQRGRLAAIKSFSCDRPSFGIGERARVEVAVEERAPENPLASVSGLVSQNGIRVCEAILLLAIGP